MNMVQNMLLHILYHVAALIRHELCYSKIKAENRRELLPNWHSSCLCGDLRRLKNQVF